MVGMTEIQDRKLKAKDNHELVKVGFGDIMKFGRVRFRIKALTIKQSSVVQDPTQKTLMRIEKVNNVLESQTTQMQSNRSLASEQLNRNPTSNFSFEAREED